MRQLFSQACTALHIDILGKIQTADRNIVNLLRPKSDSLRLWDLITPCFVMKHFQPTLWTNRNSSTMSVASPRAGVPTPTDAPPTWAACLFRAQYLLYPHLGAEWCFVFHCHLWYLRLTHACLRPPRFQILMRMILDEPAAAGSITGEYNATVVLPSFNIVARRCAIRCRAQIRLE